MVFSGRKDSGKSGKTSKENQVIRAYDFEKEDSKDLSGSEEGSDAKVQEKHFRYS